MRHPVTPSLNTLKRVVSFRVHSYQGCCSKHASAGNLKMPSTMAANDTFQPSNSVDLLQSRARKIADQSLERTRHMVVMVDESKEIGIRSLVELDEQRGKLERLDEANNEIREEIKQSENALTEMEKCCGLFVLPWKSHKSVGKSDKAWKKRKEEKVVSKQPELVIDDGYMLGDFPRITNDAVEEEINDNLMHVHSTVRNLKHIAADMNAEVLAHNKQLDKLILKADSNETHVKAATSRTDNIHR